MIAEEIPPDQQRRTVEELAAVLGRYVVEAIVNDEQAARFLWMLV